MTGDAFPIRLSHLLRHCSVGAIVRGQNFLATVKDTRCWYKNGQAPPESEIRYVDQVRNMLGVSERLCTPPDATVSESGKVERGGWVPVVRFPTWMRCPRCGLLHSKPWKDKPPDQRLVCERRDGNKCEGNLEQAPWVIVHEAGYMADVPWHSVAHFDKSAPRQHQCPPDWNSSYLELVDMVDQRQVRCTRCGAHSKLPTVLPFPEREWQQPWISEPPKILPDELAWLLEINDVRVHASHTSSALVIPPESRIRKGTVLDRLYGNSAKQRILKRARTALQRKRDLRIMAREWRCSPSEIEAAMQEIDNGYPLYDDIPECGDLSRGEYAALVKPEPDFDEDEDFVTNHRTEGWKALAATLSPELRKVINLVDRLVEVRRLKEIVVLRGFSRLGARDAVPPDITRETGWLPAIALRGEGVFFTLNESVMSNWATQRELESRAKVSRHRCDAHWMPSLAEDVDISPRFILLHTMAHAIIRTLEAEAGYPAASLKERIYSAPGPNPLAGVLVYVAVPDEVGSLGGLVEMAEPKRFLRAFRAALDSMEWCSLDPVCSEHEGQGPAWLNRAACQACALVPEPSCQYGNVLLDRTFLKGNYESGTYPLLDFAES